jgi:hypothetical protein
MEDQRQIDITTEWSKKNRTERCSLELSDTEQASVAGKLLNSINAVIILSG